MTIAIVIRGVVADPPSFQSAMRRWLPEARAFPGNVSVELFTDQDAPGRILIHGVWDGADAASRYFSWREESGVSARFAEYFSEGPVTSRWTHEPTPSR